MASIADHNMRRHARGACRTLTACAVAAVLLLGCAAQIDRRGHFFTEADLQQIQPGMSKDQVRLALGTPDTTSTVGGDAFYYISSTESLRPLGKPKIIDRKVVAVYFDPRQSVTHVATYGLKDGKVVNFAKNETPSLGKEASFLEQMFGNLGTRREYAKQLARGGADAVKP